MFWDVMLCSMTNSSQHFGGVCLRNIRDYTQSSQSVMSLKTRIFIHTHTTISKFYIQLLFSYNTIPAIIIQYRCDDSENAAGPAGCTWLRVPLIKAGCDMMHNKWHITTTLWVAQLKHSLNVCSRNVRRSAPAAQLVKNGCDMTYIHTSQPFWLAGHRHWLPAVIQIDIL